MSDTAERAYLVMGTDAAGDIDLFATDDRDRADERLEQMLVTHTDVRANWLEQPPSGTS